MVEVEQMQEGRTDCMLVEGVMEGAVQQQAWAAPGQQLT